MRALRAPRDATRQTTAEDAGTPRRTVLRGSLATAGLFAVGVQSGQPASAVGHRTDSSSVAAEPTPHDARVVVVGAGLAGLTAAYRLARRGVHVQVFEARDDRVGGRCWTARGFSSHQIAEHGGERIDTRHTHIRKLAGELGLELEEENPDRRHGKRGINFLQGAVRDETAIYKDLDLVLERLRADTQRIGSYFADRASRAARDFDQLSVRDWLQANVPGGMSSLLGSSIACGVGTFFGNDAADLSAINLIEQYAGFDDGSGADEKYHVKGGNDLIPNGLAARLPKPALHFDAPLLAVRRTGDTYRLRFGGIRREVIADRVVFALPFTTLRRVDLDDSGLSARKREAIDNHGMGTDAKLLLQFDRQFYQFDDFSGRIAADNPQLSTWDTSSYQTGAEGLLTLFVGGWSGSSYPTARPHGEPSAAVTGAALGHLEALVPGLKDAYNGHGWLDSWIDDPWARGSYASYRPGQYTKYWGWTGRPEGRLHFAGEHTSTHSQGYLNGAVESGERVAREVLTALGRS